MPLMTPVRDTLHRGKLYKGGVEQSIPDDLAAILGYKAPSTVQSVVIEGVWTSNQAVDAAWTVPAGKKYLCHRVSSQSSVGTQPWVNDGYLFWNGATIAYENYVGAFYYPTQNKFSVWRAATSNFTAGCKFTIVVDVIDI